ncbi:MAG TPA: endonuclease [Sedimenticola sp.]|nr:endonuclease [Sedimenticola sp.]
MSELNPARVRRVYERLLGAYGPQAWWPGESRFEIMVGAVLTQNTAWVNVERAIGNLRQAGVLSLGGILALPRPRLAALIRPAGYYNVKAARLGNLCRFIDQQGGEAALEAMPTERLRPALLAVNGVGPETADDILLYAFERPVFVIDSYTRRIFSRLGMIAGDEPYEVLRLGFQAALGPETALYNEYHGLIVSHAKRACAKRPACGDCCLGGDCGYG